MCPHMTICKVVNPLACVVPTSMQLQDVAAVADGTDGGGGEFVCCSRVSTCLVRPRPCVGALRPATFRDKKAHLNTLDNPVLWHLERLVRRCAEAAAPPRAAGDGAEAQQPAASLGPCGECHAATSVASTALRKQLRKQLLLHVMAIKLHLQTLTKPGITSRGAAAPLPLELLLLLRCHATPRGVMGYSMVVDARGFGAQLQLVPAEQDPDLSHPDPDLACQLRAPKQPGIRGFGAASRLKLERPAGDRFCGAGLETVASFRESSVLDGAGSLGIVGRGITVVPKPLLEQAVRDIVSKDREGGRDLGGCCYPD
ncbi:hypothetical protein VOLCADRAFT_89385 [Volvox carteri f. nagariensis]|uniref:Uncharacterized protein n=1 Tax=Volvox carteri f. nagariensis TaxID=3068 RepID=D8TRK2_VOLCA|nr:uncharacterized protein VOLCADRAFT_89385 [Volvox carteri f. nagariensis]EFJ49907.1 hypothetical protein VOLCADRAFT_89385 [Volvox carteri f. nagariensis]|eukprot:XP_002948972.1 hypothetical protein VOLCADRAFT_89385 [Volvox carteri f. nagariensis]